MTNEVKHDVGLGTSVKAGLGGAIGVGIAGIILPIALTIGVVIVLFACCIISMVAGSGSTVS